jgi:nucleoside-diphosphate-sugar epimerase
MAQLPENGRPCALVIGATGGIGGEVASALIGRGWAVRALSRSPGIAKRQSAWIGEVEWIAGDAMSGTDVISAARGVSLIFHGANPPKYRNWRGLAIPMLEASIAAAYSCGARLIFPGNIYNFGPDAWPLVREMSPQNPCSRKGAVRVEMERLLRSATDNGVRSLIVRAGDFFGPHQPASWLKDAMITPGKPIRSVLYPGDPSVGHAWAYLPDFAQAIVRLAEVEQTLPPFDVFNFGGYWIDPGIEIAKAIGHAVGQPGIKIRSAPWWLFRLAAPFSPFLRELMEMRYLWRTPVKLDNRKLVALIGDEPHRPLEEALHDVLAAYGCLTAPGPGACQAQLEGSRS